MEILLLILGAILGVAFDKLYQEMYPKIANKIKQRKLKKRHLVVNNPSVTNWLVSYYGSDEVYHCTIGNVSKKIPFLVDSNWIFVKHIGNISSLIDTVSESDDNNYPIDHNLIQSRIRGGQYVFNNPTFYTRTIVDNDGGVKIQISQTEYFRIITQLIALEEETFDAILSKNPRTLIRDRYFPDLITAKSLKLRPLSFGVTVGFVFNQGSTKKFIVQTRSKQTVTFGGSKALFPCFGLAPIEDTIDKTMEKLLYCNFVKEYLEEFFDYEDLIDKLTARRVDPLWYMELPEAIEIDRAKRNRKLKFSVLGFGIDGLNGTTTLSLLAELSDIELGSKIMKNTIGNWEVEEPTVTDLALELLDIFSPKLDYYLENDMFNYSSAFTIERIQQYYRRC